MAFVDKISEVLNEKLDFFGLGAQYTPAFYLALFATLLVVVAFVIAVLVKNASEAKKLSVLFLEVSKEVDELGIVDETNLGKLNQIVGKLPAPVYDAFGKFLEAPNASYPSDYMPDSMVMNDPVMVPKHKAGLGLFRGLTSAFIALAVIFASIGESAVWGFAVENATYVALCVASVVALPFLIYIPLAVLLNASYRKQLLELSESFKELKLTLNKHNALWADREDKFVTENVEEINAAIEEILKNRVQNRRITELLEVEAEARQGEDLALAAVEEVFVPEEEYEYEPVPLPAPRAVIEEEPVVEEAIEEVVEEPIVEEVVEEAVEEPIVEEATEEVIEEAIEEPVAEEPIVEEIAEEAVVEEVIEEIAEEPAVEEIVEEIIEEPIVEEVVEEPVVEEVIEESAQSNDDMYAELLGLVEIMDGFMSDPNTTAEHITTCRGILNEARLNPIFNEPLPQQIFDTCLGILADAPQLKEEVTDPYEDLLQLVQIVDGLMQDENTTADQIEECKAILSSARQGENFATEEIQQIFDICFGILEG